MACRRQWPAGRRGGIRRPRNLERFTEPAERNCMGFHHFAGAAFRALTTQKDGPSLYDVCDPLLQKYRGGDPHLGKFYRTALGNPALRPLLRRTGLPALKDEGRLQRLRAALTHARDDAEPDWEAVGTPIAELMADIGVRHPEPAKVTAVARAPA